MTKTALAPKDHLADFIKALIAAHEAGSRFTPEGPVPTTDDEAYAVQAAVAARFGPIGGFKVGPRPDAPAIMAPIRADRIVSEGGVIPLGDRLGVELEVGLEIIAPIPIGADAATIARCVRPRPVIEIVDTRIAGPLADDPMVKLADQQANGFLVVGDAAADWDGQDFTQVTMGLATDDAVLKDGDATVPGGSALSALATFSHAVGDHCGGLKTGQMVITGSLNGLPYVSADTEIHGEIKGLGRVSCRLSR